jgi:phosphoribosylamine--glycine ligase
MERAGVPTAAWGEFTTLNSALEYLDTQAAPYVVKADGLAAGKGVLVTDSRQEAVDWIRRCLGGSFGRPAVVIEEFLAGPEISVFALCAGLDAVALDPARDYKRLRDGDRGPNTGGMGSFSPVRDVPQNLLSFTTEQIFRPVLEVMQEEGRRYFGFLYAGLVLTEKGPTVLEFNCRLGDPETQPILLRLKSDLLELVERAIAGNLKDVEVEWDRRTALGVVLASHGYPDEPRKGDAIGGLPKPSADCRVFHAGTRLEGKSLLTSGGRVLCVTALGDSVRMARTRAYEAVERIRFDGMQYRKDIGHRALKK